MAAISLLYLQKVDVAETDAVVHFSVRITIVQGLAILIGAYVAQSDKVQPVLLDPPSAFLRLPEDTKVGTLLYTINGQKTSYKYSLVDTSQTQFSLAKDAISLKAKFDFEKKSSHHLLVRVSEGLSTVNFTLFVDVVNVYDEAPKISLKSSVSIPEELPVGTMIGQLFTVTDADPGDTLTCALTGPNAKYFEAVNCTLKMKLRIDRDGANGVKKLDKIGLTVTDMGKLSTSQAFTVDIVDINDNPPTFEKPIYIIPIDAKPTDQCIQKITAMDKDKDGKQLYDVELSIKDGNNAGVFNLASGCINANLEKMMDRATLQKVKGSYSLLIEAKDKPATGVMPLVATTTVVVKVSSVGSPAPNGKKTDGAANPNKLAPEWVKPIPVRGKFKTVKVSETAKPGSVVFHVEAKDQDSGLGGRVVYGFSPKLSKSKNAKQNKAGMYLTMDALTGDLRVAMPLDRDKKSGGVANFKIYIYANDSATPHKSIKAWVTISITNENDNPPSFDKSLYDTSYGCKHKHEKEILSMSILDYDKDPIKAPVLGGKGNENYGIYKTGRNYLLRVKSDSKRDQLKDAIDVVTVNATDGKYTSTAIVVVRFQSCAPDPTTVKPTTSKHAPTTSVVKHPVTHIPSSTSTAVLTTTTEGTTTSTRATTSTTEVVSTTGEAFVTLCTTVRKETLPTTLATEPPTTKTSTNSVV
ncbi:cadherin EGF LAG seven-pass G-type receptor fmi-1-like [Haliotis rufescens]|uniref:cadherin EGF LAG seven-pass G-type receptor fmi-1-like n=1 Tax=Haliotis rufescens TaxID=6454 RepID=UPI00201F1F60|nr:cadherin EGF LAG seven-pass G-type receptor fmi-1-like [Haliotis rufescens]